MKTHELRTRSPQILKHVKTTCDFCGTSWQTEFSNPTQFSDFYRSLSVHCFMDNTSYLDRNDPSTQRTEFDMCPDCFKLKFIPWAESLGATPTIHNLDEDEKLLSYNA